MGVCFDPDNDMFQMALRSEIYIDKTGLLSVTNQLLRSENRFMCISRPRRFGKSMSLNMLCAYYSRGCDSKELFKKYQIAKERTFKEHPNKYHVIQLNMRSYLDDIATVAEMIRQITEDILFDPEDEMTQLRLRNKEKLSRICMDIYQQTKTAFVFLIDEWDAIFRVKKWGKEAQEKSLNFLRNLLKDQPYVALAYMTGILPIKKYGEHSALNMFTEYSMTESIPISGYMGFTTEEVKKLSKSYGVSYDEIQM